ncbi:MAG: L,D-transpeptidase [Polyangiaceae bacterium]|nr:L,D-transpeptidase [Polyangiaceae bacterium]
MAHFSFLGSAVGVLTAASVAGLFGCERSTDAKPGPDGKQGVALARLQGREPASGTDGTDWSAFPSPPADGPKLVPVALSVPIKLVPNPAAETIGYLRVGARVARSAAPVSHTGCPEGWYAVRPVGFVCVNAEATIKLDHPIARAIQVEPDRSKPMPYKYAFVRSVAPNYLRIPTKSEQFRYEMRLDRHLRNYKKLAHKWDALDVGANDVPLDENGLATGAIPDHAVPMDMSERYGGNGDDRVPWWLEGERRIPNISSFRAPPYAIIANRISRHGGTGLIGTFVAGPNAQDRRFAIATDGRLIPADKLKADSGSPFHGHSIREVGLPVAFVGKPDASFYRYEGTSLIREERAKFRSMVPLDGTVREVGGTRVVRTRSGLWLKSNDLKTAAKPSQLPSFAKRGVRWIDVSIMSQVLVLWEGSTPVYATLVSTGRDGLGDPKTTLSTPTGVFRVFQKHITTTMDSAVADHEFELRDVPWVMYFKAGYALHGAYWHDDFGRARSHGCVNLSPIDARYVFLWSTPDVPEHWHAAYSSGPFGEGILVNIHP